MLVEAKIMDVEMRQHKGKSVADVTIKMTEPTQIVTTTFWNNQVMRDEHKVYAELAGETVRLALREPELFNDKIQYKINTAVAPVKIGPAVVQGGKAAAGK